MFCGVGIDGPRFSAAPNFWADAGRIVEKSSIAINETRLFIRNRIPAGASPELQFDDTSDNLGPGEEQVPGAADRKLRSFQCFDGIPDRVSPGIHLRIQIIVHVEDWCFDVRKLLYGFG